MCSNNVNTRIVSNEIMIQFRTTTSVQLDWNLDKSYIFLVHNDHKEFSSKIDNYMELVQLRLCCKITL